MSDSLWPHEAQHARPPCPSPTPGVYSNSCPLSQWCHPAIASSVVPFSSCPQSFPASGSFKISQFFAWGGQSIGVLASASVLPMNIHYWNSLFIYSLVKQIIVVEEMTAILHFFLQSNNQVFSGPKRVLLGRRNCQILQNKSTSKNVFFKVIDRL